MVYEHNNDMLCLNSINPNNVSIRPNNFFRNNFLYNKHSHQYNTNECMILCFASCELCVCGIKIEFCVFYELATDPS